jgi:hypothetical protein
MQDVRNAVSVREVRTRQPIRSGPRRFPIEWKRTVSFLTLDVSRWAEETFGSCDLQDARRTRRAVKVAQQMAEHPDGSSPAQAERWADLKALYRLFDQEEVTFEALASPHWQQTRTHAAGTVLLLGDTMETDFGIRRQTRGLGPTGDGDGRGFMLHSSLMIVAGTREIVGLAGQELFYRQPAPPGENSYQALQRPRESEVWGRVIDLIGPPAAHVRYVHVFDRGADTLDVFCHAREQKCDWVIRAAQLHRTVQNSHGQSGSLRKMLDQQPVLGRYELAVREGKRQLARMARIEVRATQVTVVCPKRRTAYLKSVGFESLTQWVVEAREVEAPPGADSLHWTLWTSLPAESFAEAWRVIEYYEARWLIEEYHKAVKTGCRLESRQYMEAHRLEAVAGMTCVLAVRLLQLKTAARTQPDEPAESVVPQTWLKVLRALRKRELVSLGDFFRHLAGLGGFLMRKGDGDPGWITLWRGLDKLLLAVRGYEALRCG